MLNYKDTIITKDRLKFLIFEMKYHNYTSISKYIEHMKGLYTTCQECGVYYWIDCEKRCVCVSNYKNKQDD